MMKLELVSGSFPGWCPGSISRPCQSLPDRTYHTGVICPGPAARQEGLRFRSGSHRRGAYKDICLQKIKATFWSENLLSMHILGSSVLSSFLKERA